MYYLAFLIVFIGEFAIRSLLLNQSDAFAPAFMHGLCTGIGVLTVQMIIALAQDIRKPHIADDFENEPL